MCPEHWYLAFSSAVFTTLIFTPKAKLPSSEAPPFVALKEQHLLSNSVGTIMVLFGPSALDLASTRRRTRILMISVARNT